MVKLYGIKNCDSVRKAQKFLKTHEIPFLFIDFRETPVDETMIRTWLETCDLKTLFNTRGTTYRTLKLKALDLDEEEKITWLAKENMLIKRPVITLDDDLIIGYNEAVYAEKLLSLKGS
jgi:Spx/MgsR family transcriptional regulator